MRESPNAHVTWSVPAENGPEEFIHERIDAAPAASTFQVSPILLAAHVLHFCTLGFARATDSGQMSCVLDRSSAH